MGARKELLKIAAWLAFSAGGLFVYNDIRKSERSSSNSPRYQSFVERAFKAVEPVVFYKQERRKAEITKRNEQRQKLFESQERYNNLEAAAPFLRRTYGINILPRLSVSTADELMDKYWKYYRIHNSLCIESDAGGNVECNDRRCGKVTAEYVDTGFHVWKFTFDNPILMLPSDGKLQLDVSRYPKHAGISGFEDSRGRHTFPYTVERTDFMTHLYLDGSPGNADPVLRCKLSIHNPKSKHAYHFVMK